MIHIIGIGTGNKEYLTLKAIETVKNADIVAGSKRALNLFDVDEHKKYVLTKNLIRELKDLIANNKDKDIALFVSYKSYGLESIHSYDEMLKVIGKFLDYSNFKFLIIEVRSEYYEDFRNMVLAKANEGKHNIMDFIKEFDLQKFGFLLNAAKNSFTEKESKNILITEKEISDYYTKNIKNIQIELKVFKYNTKPQRI